LDGLGRSYSFGENSKGQLGLGHRRNQFQPTPMLVPPSVLLVGADCGGTHTLLLADDAKVYACGNNEQRQLGMRSLEDVLVPTFVALRASGLPRNVQRISCGFSHSLILDASGSVWILGGCKPGADDTRPRRACGALASVRVEDVAAGGGHALCLAQTRVFGFGVGSAGQHNDDDERTQSPTPKLVVL
jgi:alpha-tubulin suppressor-like RCC1 family protein